MSHNYSFPFSGQFVMTNVDILWAWTGFSEVRLSVIMSLRFNDDDVFRVWSAKFDFRAEIPFGGYRWNVCCKLWAWRFENYWPTVRTAASYVMNVVVPFGSWTQSYRPEVVFIVMNWFFLSVSVRYNSTIKLETFNNFQHTQEMDTKENYSWANCLYIVCTSFPF